MSYIQASCLYIVATPIGNLQDMSARAIEVLSQVDIICCEDTRHSKRLLEHFSIKGQLQSLHDHNEKDKSAQIVAWLESGQSIALISDAGTPLISDPGCFLVTCVKEAGFEVYPIPGACAIIAALSVSGLPTDRFYFEGFVPAKSSNRVARFESLKDFEHTWVYYESPHRIQDSLKDLQKVLGPQHTICFARELTKTFETIKKDSIENILKLMDEDRNQTKGEFVIMVQGATCAKSEDDNESEMLLKLLIDENIPLKTAAKIAAQHCGEKKNKLYKLALSWQEDQ
ncbi:16S rRNA (cytidine(1402)-2'-O)-methyltransferase [Marinicellulosiphila megalodicopiae]|uniref:16S rRNA (cytidine(1402)-2'-O)-methyltransferase n=1 Tax=Marinicellulosiphila megalodicopiae TaxID=2724896 RepID=UPI003BAFB7CC